MEIDYVHLCEICPDHELVRYLLIEGDTPEIQQAKSMFTKAMWPIYVLCHPDLGNINSLTDIAQVLGISYMTAAKRKSRCQERWPERWHSMSDGLGTLIKDNLHHRNKALRHLDCLHDVVVDEQGNVVGALLGNGELNHYEDVQEKY